MLRKSKEYEQIALVFSKTFLLSQRKPWHTVKNRFSNSGFWLIDMSSVSENILFVKNVYMC